MIVDVKKILEESGIHVLEVFDILDYPNMLNLIPKLRPYQEHVFSPNDRLVFIHCDPEFIIDNIRFDTFNLQKILFNLNIPNFACIIVSQQNLTKELELYKKMTTEKVSIGYIHTECHLVNMTPFEIDSTQYNLNETLVEKPYIFLSNQRRAHRALLFKWLFHNDILKNGLVSFNNIYNKQISSSDIIENSKDIEINIDGLHLLTTSPPAKSNDIWVAKDEKLIEIFSTSIPNLYKNFKEENDLPFYFNNSSLIQKAFCYISNETVFNYPTYTSEKSFKQFPAMRPMISYASKGCLAKLRDYGFKTWSDWWSEDYDNIDNPEDRFLEVAKLINHIASFSVEDCKSILLEMQEVLEYNQSHYLKNFIINQKESVRQQAMLNLKGKSC